MKDFNNFIFSGRPTRVPDKKVVKDRDGNDMTMASFTIAVNRQQNPQTGKSQADYVFCRCFGPKAEEILKVTTRTRLIIHGEFRTVPYEKDGKPSSYNYILVNEFIIADGANSRSNQPENMQNGVTENNSHGRQKNDRHSADAEMPHQTGTQSVNGTENGEMRPAGYKPPTGGETGQNPNQRPENRSAAVSQMRPQGYSHPMAGNGTGTDAAQTNRPERRSTTNRPQLDQGRQRQSIQDQSQGQRYPSDGQRGAAVQSSQQNTPFFSDTPMQFNGFENILDDVEDDLPFH